MMEVPKVVFGQVTVYLGDRNGKYPDGNQVVVRGTEAKAIFDTPLVANELKAELAGTDMAILGHVHEDHCAGLHLLPEAQIFAHEYDVNAMRSIDGLMTHYGLPEDCIPPMVKFVKEDFFFEPRPDAQGFNENTRWDLGGSTVHVIHAPGHTTGHSILFVEPEGVAFIGDIDLTGFGPYYGDGCSSLEAFEKTLEALKTMDAKVWVTSHHKGVITEREVFDALLETFRGKIDQREEAMFAQIQESPKTLQELTDHRFLYPQWYEGIWAESCERLTLVQHLARLSGAGRIELDENGRYHARH